MDWSFTFICLVNTLPYHIQGQPETTLSINDGILELSGRGRMIPPLVQADVNMIIETVHDYCRYYQSCDRSKTVPENVTEIIGFCNACDCNDNCYSRGTCCSDKTGPFHDKSPRGEICTAVRNLAQHNEYNSFMMVAECTTDFQGEFRDKCLHSQPHIIFDLAPVYSVTSDLHYRNIYCARCNNDTQSIVPWEGRLKCNSADYVNWFSVIADHIDTIEDTLQEKGCAIHWTQPASVAWCYDYKMTFNDAKYKPLYEKIPRGHDYIQHLYNRIFCAGHLLSDDYCIEDKLFIGDTFESHINWQAFPIFKSDAYKGTQENDTKKLKLCINATQSYDNVIGNSKEFYPKGSTHSAPPLPGSPPTRSPTQVSPHRETTPDIEHFLFVGFPEFPPTRSSPSPPSIQGYPPTQTPLTETPPPGTTTYIKQFLKAGFPEFPPTGPTPSASPTTGSPPKRPQSQGTTPDIGEFLMIGFPETPEDVPTQTELSSTGSPEVAQFLAGSTPSGPLDVQQNNNVMNLPTGESNSPDVDLYTIYHIKL